MPDRERSAQLLVDRIVNDPQMLDRVQANPKAELPALAAEVLRGIPPALQTDVWIYRIVVSILGMAVVIALLGAVFLMAKGQERTPDILTAIGSAAVGALAGLLAPVQSSRS